MKLFTGILLALGLGGCVPTLTPELIAALARDDASFCATSDVHGGVGGAALPALAGSGGYGSATLAFCRSNHDGAALSVKPDGTITITHN